MLKIPPFKDSHIHFTIDGKSAEMQELLNLKNDYQKRGILSVTDMGHKSGIGIEIRESWRDSINVESSGRAIFKKGSYGSFLGIAVETKKEIRQAVEFVSGMGADFIKVINSGIAKSSGLGVVSEGGFSGNELIYLVDVAEGEGVSVACHANGDVAIRDAVKAGAASIEHGFFISRETLDIMAEMRTAWTPTANALLSVIAFADGDERCNIEKIVDGHLEMINYAASLGLKLNVGSDAGSKGINHGDAFFDELRLFKKAGLSGEQIIAAACADKIDLERGIHLLVEEDFILTGIVEVIDRSFT